MSDHRIKSYIELVARRLRGRWMSRLLLAYWGILAIVGLLAAVWQVQAGRSLPGAAPGLAVAAAVGLLLANILSRRIARDPLFVARQIEHEFPGLESRLLTALEQTPQTPEGQFGFLQEMVIQQTSQHARMHAWESTVSNSSLIWSRGGSLVSLLLLCGALTALGMWKPPAKPTAAGGDPLRVSAAVGDFQVTVEPGDTEVERGSSLLVLARFADQHPADIALSYVAESAATVNVPMTKSLDDPLFAGRITRVQTDLEYRVIYGAQQTKSFRVTVFEYPQLVRADADLQFPSYTGLEPTRIEDIRRVTAVEGTKILLSVKLNKSVDRAQLVAKQEDQSLQLTADPQQPKTYQVELRLTESRRFRLELTDDQGRANRQPPEFVFKVTPNARPDLKLARPVRDVRVSPLEELQLQANVWDDFGVPRYGVSVSPAGLPPTEVVLGEELNGRQRQDISHVLDFESLKSQPDQLVSYHFWAEDIGPDGQVRRTLSDMYFAEVRHFEEIFRQGQQPSGQQQQQQQQQSGQQAGGNAQAAEKLAELQKQIISATWKILRIDLQGVAADKFMEDVRLVEESQTDALQQLETLAEKLTDGESAAHVGDVRTHMNRAVDALKQTEVPQDRDPLQRALAAEQSAYQALLKLRAREHEVVQQNSQQQQSGQGGRQASGRSQQQLQQLELSDSDNRYETQRAATAPQNQQQRENRQVLNRLRELARRQQDLNKRLKDLQTALEAAETEQEREEVRKQLKRLRDEEQRILRDTDELQERMSSPENQERMAENREQLQQTRENVRRASEALEQGMVPRATAAGTRAERELNELRDEFRKRAANQFSEEMREMRENARQLASDEKQLQEQLEELTAGRDRSLRDSGQRNKVEQGFDQQRERLDDLLKRMQETVEEAELAEPLLSQQLYDTLRDARHNQIDENLKMTSELLKRGFVPDAQRVEQQAQKHVDQLRKGVERATESVLGDENQALQRALDDVRQLADQLNQEIQRSRPPGEQTASRRPGENQRPGEQQPGQQPGQQRGQERPSGARLTPSAGGSAGGNDRPLGPDGRIGDFRDMFDRRNAAPLTGADFRDWSDRLRDVEEMMSDAELRSDAARIRDRARNVRIDLKRHSREPNWDLVESMIAEPLHELQRRIEQELLKRQSRDALVPIDRDPVPPGFEDSVRRYYERLGAGK